MSIKNTTDRTIANAAREAAAQETRRCAEVAALCVRLNQPDEMIAQILSGRSTSEVEALLRQKAGSASWDKAIAAAALPN